MREKAGVFHQRNEESLQNMDENLFQPPNPSALSNHDRKGEIFSRLRVSFFI